MKPNNWKQMSEEERKEMAVDLFKSTRGAYIVSQALCIAAKEMRKAPMAKREVSNIEDMEIFIEELFPIGLALGLYQV